MVNTETVSKAQRQVLRFPACPDLHAEVAYIVATHWEYTPNEGVGHPREQTLGSLGRMKSHVQRAGYKAKHGQQKSLLRKEGKLPQ